MHDFLTLVTWLTEGSKLGEVAIAISGDKTRIGMCELEWMNENVFGILPVPRLVIFAPSGDLWLTC